MAIRILMRVRQPVLLSRGVAQRRTFAVCQAACKTFCERCIRDASVWLQRERAKSLIITRFYALLILIISIILAGATQVSLHEGIIRDGRIRFSTRNSFSIEKIEWETARKTDFTRFIEYLFGCTRKFLEGILLNNFSSFFFFFFFLAFFLDLSMSRGYFCQFRSSPRSNFDPGVIRIHRRFVVGSNFVSIIALIRIYIVSNNRIFRIILYCTFICITFARSTIVHDTC